MDRRTDGPRTTERLPRAQVRKSYVKWLIWIFPVAAVVFVAVLLYNDMLDEKRLITVYFKNADGVEAGNTPVKCRGADVGTVKKISLTKDHNWVSVGIQLDANEENLARVGSVFWVVRAELGAGVVTGLQTVMSGSYLQVRPGDGTKTNFFIGLSQAPIEKMPEKSIPIILRSPTLNSVEEGSPIYYRGIQCGEVIYYQLGPYGQDVVIHAVIHHPYGPLLRQDSVFWNAGGLDVHFGLLHGLDVSAESARALVAGAIEFATPTIYDEPATNGASFQLYDKPDSKWKEWQPVIQLELPPAAPEEEGMSSGALPQTGMRK